MRGVNKVIIVGTLGKDPELRHLPSGDAVVTLSVATNESWKDKGTGETKERTEWHRVVLFGRRAEVAAEYLRKGSKAYFEGKLRTKEWEKDGTKRYTTEVVADSMQFIEGGSGGGQRQSGGKPTAEKVQGDLNMGGEDKGGSSDFDDDIPF